MFERIVVMFMFLNFLYNCWMGYVFTLTYNELAKGINKIIENQENKYE